MAHHNIRHQLGVFFVFFFLTKIIFTVFLIFVMKIQLNSRSLSFGTQIIVRNRAEYIKHINDNFSKPVRDALTVPMCDFWTVVEEKNLSNSKLYRDKSRRIRGYQTLGLCAGAALVILFI